MFNRSKKDNSHQLDDVIKELIREIETTDVNTDDYANEVASLKTLMELRNQDKAVAKKNSVSLETIVAASAHLIGIAMILGFEKANVITSKSLGFVPKI